MEVFPGAGSFSELQALPAVEMQQLRIAARRQRARRQIDQIRAVGFVNMEKRDKEEYVRQLKYAAGYYDDLIEA